jgi:hypothetical protein
VVDGKPEGKVVVEVYDDVAIGGQRFIDLAKGKRGVGYRRSKVDLIEDVRIHSLLYDVALPDAFQYSKHSRTINIKMTCSNAPPFILSFQDYIRLDGVASLSYDSSGESPITGGEDVFKLEVRYRVTRPTWFDYLDNPQTIYVAGKINTIA